MTPHRLQAARWASARPPGRFGPASKLGFGGGYGLRNVCGSRSRSSASHQTRHRVYPVKGGTILGVHGLAIDDQRLNGDQ